MCLCVSYSFVLVLFCWAVCFFSCWYEDYGVRSETLQLNYFWQGFHHFHHPLWDEVSTPSHLSQSSESMMNMFITPEVKFLEEPLQELGEVFWAIQFWMDIYGGSEMWRFSWNSYSVLCGWQENTPTITFARSWWFSYKENKKTLGLTIDIFLIILFIIYHHTFSIPLTGTCVALEPLTKKHLEGIRSGRA